MTEKPNFVMVKAEHIEPGIAKYGGQPDKYLQSLIDHADLHYSAYRFNDGRILLVLPENISGILYKDQKTMMDHLTLN